MNLKNKIFNSPYFLVTIIVLSVTIVLSLYWVFIRQATYKQNSADINTLNNFCTDISNFDLALKDCTTSQSIDVEKSSKALEIAIPKLESIYEDLNESEISSENNNLKISLCKSLNYSIDFFKDLSKVLNNPKTTNISTYFTNLQEKRDLFLDSVNNSNTLAITYPLSEDTKLFIKNSMSYVNNLVKVNRDLSINRSNLNDYLINMSSLNDDIKAISQDLFSSIDEQNEEDKPLNLIDDNIYKKQLSLSTIKNKFNEISVPSSCMDNYILFDNTIKSCQEYINKIQSAVENNMKDKDSADYEDAKQSYDAFKADLEKFNTSYKSLK